MALPLNSFKSGVLSGVYTVTARRVEAALTVCVKGTVAAEVLPAGSAVGSAGLNPVHG